MKESKETHPKASSSLLEPGRWQHRGSMSSHRSIQSNQSQDSHKSRKARSTKSRPRRMSLTSMVSQAVSMNSSSSVETNNLSRKTSHADDSDASDTNESLGETEEDVWFPTDARDNGDINVDELDQLLNLSGEDSDDGDNDKTHIGDATNKRDHSTPRKKNTGGGGGGTGGRFQVGESIPEEQLDLAGVRRTESPRKKFVEYRTQSPFESTNLASSSRGSSSNSSDLRGLDKEATEKVNAGFVDNDSSNEQLQRITETKIGDLTFGVGDEEDENYTNYVSGRPPIKKRVSDPHVNLVNENPGVVVDDQQSQRYSFFAPGLENTVHAPDLASLVGESNSFSSLFNPENGTWFLDCFRPTDIEMKALSRAFGIHPLTSEDIQTEDAREKYESFKNYYLVVYHTFENDRDDPNYMEAINFYVLVFKDGVISFHFEPVSHCRNVRRRMRQLRDYLSFTPDWVAYALIDDITDSFAPEINRVEKETDFIEDAVYLDSDGSIEMSTLLRRLGEGRRHTMHLLRMLSGKADVVRGFAKRINERGMPTEMNLYLGDIQDHIVTMYQNLSAYEKIFSRTHFNYMGLLQMEFVDSSNRMTGVLGKVTILGTVLVPMNLITGLFGMNVKVPGQEVENLRWFFGILGVVLFLITTLLVSSALYVKFSINKRNPARVNNS